MSSMVITVFKATIGLLVIKGRDKLAEVLKDGDVTDQKFHSLIVREIDDIKSKLDALSRKDLEASISFFEEGIALLYEVFDIAKSRSECGAATAHVACDEAFSLIEGIRRLELTDLDESATRKLCAAKKRFKDARREATRAFKNEGLKTSDRILAMKYRVMATILETVDNPADAVASCGVCVKELNSMPAVKNNFHVQLKTGIQKMRSLIGKEERKEIISAVCHVNRVIVDVTHSLGRVGFWTCPSVDIGENRIILLCDARVTNVLLTHDKRYCCVPPWSFGQEGEEQHKLEDPKGIATNSNEEFIVADRADLKVFDRSGKFVKHINLPLNEEKTNVEILEVATDMDDSIFVLTKMENTITCWRVHKLTKTADVHRVFRLGERGDESNLLSFMESGEVLKLTFGYDGGVEEFDINGKFVRKFGEEMSMQFCLRHATVADDSRVMVLGSNFFNEFYVHIFSKHGDLPKKFRLKRDDTEYTRITFHRAGEHVVVAGAAERTKLLHVEMYSKDGEFVRSLQIQNDGIHEFQVRGITVTTEGRIAVVVGAYSGCKVFVF